MPPKGTWNSSPALSWFTLTTPWLRDGLGLIVEAGDTEALARSLDGNDGVYFVPALAGLGSPHWAPEARGLITGLTRGTNHSLIGEKSRRFSSLGESRFAERSSELPSSIRVRTSCARRAPARASSPPRAR